MLSQIKLPITSEDDAILEASLQVTEKLYGKGQVYAFRSCPVTGELALLIDYLDTFPTAHPSLNEIWILFLPICVVHKPCISCFQDTEEIQARGIRALRDRVIRAATLLVAQVHATAVVGDSYIPPLVASSRALTAGCVLVTSISKKWTEAAAHVDSLLRCSEILTTFGPCWRGGQSYLEIWREVWACLN